MPAIMSDELRVPKRRAEVEVLLPGGSVRQVAVFLAPLASAHDGPERLSDLLNGGERFVPAVDLASGEMVFLGCEAIAAARTSREFEPGEEASIATEHEVEIALSDGTLLRGLVTYVLPPERSRLLDYLNDDSLFVRLVEPERVALVNKRHIARVGPVR